MPTKILCATDETEASRKAEVVAVQLAKATGAQLTFVHVEAKTPADTVAGWDATTCDEAMAEKHEVLSHSVKAARDNDVQQAEYAISRSFKIVSSIVHLAGRDGYDHIVCGTTGRTGIPRFFVGSAESGIIHKAHCPVTVVR
jgi:nucleotide-binding universal stress UspA family protein